MPLGQLQAGDTVYSFDLELHEVTLSQISVVLNRCVGKHLCVEIAGHRLQTTEDHPFYLDNGELVSAKDLSADDFLLGVDDLSYPVDAVTPVADALDVINLSLDSYHNFFVSLDDHDAYVPNQTALILVHNCEVDLNLEAELVSVEPLFVSPARLLRKALGLSVTKAPPVRGSGAVNIALIDKLKHQLRLESAHSPFTPQGYLKPEVIKEAEIAIAADKIKNSLIPNGYAKYKTQNFMSPAGEFRVHFYKCGTTGRVYYGHDYKAKVVWNKMSRKP